MIDRRKFLKTGAISATGLTLLGKSGFAAGIYNSDYVSNRPSPSDRKFTSESVEETIEKAKKKIGDPKLSWMFENCFPNTLDTTVDYNIENGESDTFVITGDIDAMWLRDSSAQVWPYLPLASDDDKLKSLLSGVIRRQTRCILLDPYANAFYKEQVTGEWKDDLTDMKPGVHERKWEIDSLCYPVRLAYNYWQKTGDGSVFDKDWQNAAALTLMTFREQQRKSGPGPYHFQRMTTRQLDTLSNDGYGRPVRPVGLINSSFRPSDDATTFGFLIPSNLFAVLSLKQMAEISEKITGDMTFAQKCRDLSHEVEQAIQQYGIADHPVYGRVYAYETDGFGNATFMDDANAPNLLALPYLGCVPENDEIYQNTRKLVWSSNNPYFFKGKAGEGIGGPHVGYNMIWPMSIIMYAMTSDDDQEISSCIKTLRDTDAGTGFMHESFNKDNPGKFTRSWFAWANTIFGELILKLIREGKENCFR